MHLDVVQYVSPSADGGWGPVTHAARLAARLFGAEFQPFHPAAEYSRLWRAASLFPRPIADGARLSIVSHPGDLLALRRPSLGSRRYELEAVWIFDAFWDDRLPRFARGGSSFDILFVTDQELVPLYAELTGVPVHWIPWGTDTRSMAGSAGARTTDVLRVGRQPSSWADDRASADSFARVGLSFEGRPPFGRDDQSSRSTLFAALSRSKMTLAWGNAHAPSDYTHPSREYISGRWTDAMACGTQVLGIPPDCAAARLLPAEALVIPDGTEEGAVLAAASAATQAWTPDIAQRIRAHAVSHLDWRHRFDAIRTAMDIDAPRLDADLQALVTPGATGGA